MKTRKVHMKKGELLEITADGKTTIYAILGDDDEMIYMKLSPNTRGITHGREGDYRIEEAMRQIKEST